MPKIKEQTPTLAEQHAQAVAHLDGINREIHQISAELSQLEAKKESALSTSLDKYTAACDALSDAQKKHARRTEHLQAQAIGAAKAVGEAKRELDKEALQQATLEADEAFGALFNVASQYASVYDDARRKLHQAKRAVDDVAERVTTARARALALAQQLGEPTPNLPTANPAEWGFVVAQAIMFKTKAATLVGDNLPSVWIQVPQKIESVVRDLRNALGAQPVQDASKFSVAEQLDALLSGGYITRVRQMSAEAESKFADNRKRIAEKEAEQKKKTESWFGLSFRRGVSAG